MYSMEIRWSEEDAGYIALSPEFDGLSAFGETVKEAAAELEIALQLAVEEFHAEGWSLPEPRKHQLHSGQFRVRLPRSLHSWLVSAAEHDAVSLNTFIVARLSEVRGQRETIAIGEMILNRWVTHMVESQVYQWPSSGYFFASQEPPGTATVVSAGGPTVATTSGIGHGLISAKSHTTTEGITLLAEAV